DNVYEESNQKQQPLSINGLKQYEAVYLNYVLPPASVIIWDEVESEERESILKEQDETKACYDSFPNVDDMIDPENEDFKKAEEFTQSILSELPSGEIDKTDTLCHIINQLFQNENRQCLFFDSRQGIKLYNTFENLIDVNFKSMPFVLKLISMADLGNQENINDKEDDLRIIKTLNEAIRQNKSHPVLNDLTVRLANAHDTGPKNIVVKNVYLGTYSIVYTVTDLARSTIEALQKISTKLKSQFKQFVAAKVHPLLYRPTFDIVQFDERGAKDFLHESGTFHMGPIGRTQIYTQPVGWHRHGWNVLGRYPSDKWLHPFQDPENWYRAFHGTKNAKLTDSESPKNMGIDIFF
ncbi:unnamed protein product, partial [Rotaria sp. Silwood1]